MLPSIILHSFAAIGIMSTLLIVLSFLQLFISIASHWTRYAFKPKKANWAVVTGASEGIGREFAVQLANKGYDLVLISRSQVKLDAVNLGREAQVIPFDFGSASVGDWNKLAMKLDKLNIGVLINNVGVSHDSPVPFLDEDPERCEMITAVNIDALLKITRIILPQMLSRNHGLVLNIGSMLGKVPSSLLSVYSGSKAFVRQWSQCLSEEVKAEGVHVEHINTLFVQTAMSKIRKSSLTVPSPTQFVKSVLKGCGNSTDSTLYPSHALIDWILSYVPEWLKMKMVSDMHVDIRKRVLKKRERESKEAK